jgi:small subunit ribosomal protein S13
MVFKTISCRFDSFFSRFSNYLMNLSIFGFTLPSDKKIIYSLSKLYGIGIPSAQKICRKLGLLPTLKVKDLTLQQQYNLVKLIKEKYIVENQLTEILKTSIQFYYKNGSLRGYRLRNGLPVNGQRTHTNGKTARKHLNYRK